MIDSSIPCGRLQVAARLLCTVQLLFIESGLDHRMTTVGSTDANIGLGTA